MTTAIRGPARKRFGQHFLESVWVAKLLACIRPAPDELFLEIGPGAGQLTLPIAAAGAQVVGIEIDRRLADELRQTAPPSVRIVTGDILRQDLPRLIAEAVGPQATRPVRVIGNLPYNLSTPILRRVFGIQWAHGCLQDATLMLQREVADRLVGKPGSRTYGPLAVMTQVTAESRLALTLPPGAFRPPPRVRSAVVTFAFRPSPIRIDDLPLFEQMVRSIFTRRRKTIRNALGPFAGSVSTRPPRELLERAGVAPDRRPATLNLAELAKLAETLAASSADV